MIFPSERGVEPRSSGISGDAPRWTNVPSLLRINFPFRSSSVYSETAIELRSAIYQRQDVETMLI